MSDRKEGRNVVKSPRVDLSKFPRVQVTSNKPTLREIFLLGWQHFIPSLPGSDRK
jgi:hypothetical protein